MAAAGTHAQTAGDAPIPFSIVLASTPLGGIGYRGALPARLPSDLAFFKRITTASRTALHTRNVVIMGRRTWESLPAAARPLSGRVCIVLTRSGGKSLPASPHTAGSLSAALQMAKDLPRTDRVFVVGGSEVFAEAFATPGLQAVYHTRLLNELPCDVHVPPLPAHLVCDAASLDLEEGGVTYHFARLVPGGTPMTARVPVDAFMALVLPACATPTAVALAAPAHEETQYLALVRDILTTGVARGDRTGTGTLSKFGVSMRFSLRGGVMPLLTTKRVFWRGVAEELFWFIAGGTSAATLRERGVRIWDANGTREFLDSRGLSHREADDLGPIYGFQWRHFGAAYGTMHDDYTGKGVDQLAQLVETLQHTPTDRRMILSAWNPAAQKDMALPPCHMFAQFYVAQGELSCQMYQRSADMGLGVPFNIASYALLTHLLAHVTGLVPGEFVHIIGDAHVYNNHTDALWTQLARAPRPFPTLTIDPVVQHIDDATFAHLTLTGYTPHPKIAMPMAV